MNANPFGVSSWGVPVLPGMASFFPPQIPGKVFYVCSLGGASGVSAGGAHNGGQDPDRPYSTLVQALTAARANKNDVIVVLPGHAENVATAGGITVSKAGVTIVGMGTGSRRPTFTMTATGATILVSAANVTLRNLIITSSVDELVTCISVTAAHCTLDTVDYVDGTSVQTLQFLLTNASADDLTVMNCTHVHATAPATAAAWIDLIGADRARILNNRFYITTADAGFVIRSVTTAPVNILIQGNTIVHLGGTSNVPISLVAGTSGYVRDNRVASTKTAIAGSLALASCYASENYVSNTVNTQGILDPVADT